MILIEKKRLRRRCKSKRKNQSKDFQIASAHVFFCFVFGYKEEGKKVGMRVSGVGGFGGVLACFSVEARKGGGGSGGPRALQ